MRTLDRFTIAELIAETDVAALHNATETIHGAITRPVAVKIFAPTSAEDRGSEVRFAQELTNLAAIGPTPHVLEMYAAGIAQSLPWIAFETTTTALFHQLGDVPADPRLVGQLIEQVTSGLIAVHAKGLLHNDIKPANIVLCPPGVYKLSEFSVAAPAAGDSTQKVDMIPYSAPEVFAPRDFGRPSFGTDLYALGMVAYEVALGSRLWRAQFPAVFEVGARAKDPVNPAKWMAWHCSTTTKAPSIMELQKSFPPALAAVIEKLMAKDAKQRYVSAEQAHMAVREAATAAMSAPVSAPATSSSAPAARSPAPATGSPRATSAAAGGPAAPSRAPAAPVATPAAPPPAASATTGGTQYWTRLRGRQSGPYDLATLQRMVKQGHVSRFHQVSTDGSTWRPATAIEGLFS